MTGTLGETLRTSKYGDTGKSTHHAMRTHNLVLTKRHVRLLDDVEQKLQLTSRSEAARTCIDVAYSIIISLNDSSAINRLLLRNRIIKEKGITCASVTAKPQENEVLSK